MTGPKLVMAFDSSQQALRAEMLLEDRAIEFDLIPTPGAITAGCALCLAFPETELERALAVVRGGQVEIRGIFRENDSSGEMSFDPIV